MNQEVPLTIKNYKEPLKKVEGGHGYMGCLSQTLDGEKIQCHVCGQLFQSLNLHIKYKHELTVREYKEKFQLAGLTALISESCREEMKARTVRWLNGLSPEEIKSYRNKAKKNAEHHDNKHPFKLSLESKNKRGTCPDQLLEKIKEVAKKLERTPSLSEFEKETGGQRYKHLIFKTFGSWNKALQLVNLSPVKENPHESSYTDQYLLYTLRAFAEKSNRIPTTSDCKRGLIHHHDVYKKRFGSMKNARELAGVYEFIERPQYEGQRY